MLGGRRSSDHEQAGQRQDQGGGGGEGGASREQEGAGGGGFQEVESRVQGPEDEGPKMIALTVAKKLPDFLFPS